MFAGDVGIYIKNTLSYSVDQGSKNVLSNTEHLWVDIITNKYPIKILNNNIKAHFIVLVISTLI